MSPRSLVYTGLAVLVAFCTAAVLVLSRTAPASSQESVNLLRTPDGGIQPQVAVDPQGVVHLVYYKGDPKAGDLYYVRRSPTDEDFSEPIRVNDKPGSAIAIGSIRGAQIAVGKDGRVHVVWNGAAAEPGAEGIPLYYTRLNDEGTGFEPQRNVITWAWGLDGGSAVAADHQGNVYVFWHAGPHGRPESERGVHLAVSRDGGRTFARERRISPASEGACGCCGMRAYADRNGTLYVLYRGARDNVHRDTILLVSRQGGQTFEATTVHAWDVAACPMSSAFITENQEDVLLAWQTDQQVYFARAEEGNGSVAPIPAPGQSSARKHPILVPGPEGSFLLTWTEGMGWNQDGTLVWQVYDKLGEPTPTRGRVEGVPVWSFPAGFTASDGLFTLMY